LIASWNGFHRLHSIHVAFTIAGIAFTPSGESYTLDSIELPLQLSYRCRPCRFARWYAGKAGEVRRRIQPSIRCHIRASNLNIGPPYEERYHKYSVTGVWLTSLRYFDGWGSASCPTTLPPLPNLLPRLHEFLNRLRFGYPSPSNRQPPPSLGSVITGWLLYASTVQMA
jgi:hypothetical protein